MSPPHHGRPQNAEQPRSSSDRRVTDRQDALDRHGRMRPAESLALCLARWRPALTRSTMRAARTPRSRRGWEMLSQLQSRERRFTRLFFLRRTTGRKILCPRLVSFVVGSVSVLIEPGSGQRPRGCTILDSPALGLRHRRKAGSMCDGCCRRAPRTTAKRTIVGMVSQQYRS